ncbi:50S ribosomal protein L11 methyltransferase [Rickettsiales endosymbiont of Stachyamoeba lipophora]|uniref:50S ribosomal protein L11 methyltransferase n=1 Tax=Rickettsiales endosymbiont of Stachyamoeba lipophora TaxID=2486578 RepID=UPI000F64DF90|nr:50S ribosomal protein L11 methyltransferase [Rickettsiales endosymbiont of Stachyamoeba lipophora]AZL15696.1 methyltransferase domain-containing protein [Rickettsiales endosymbiont of Stachyamoeba lipophora]
MAVFNPFQSFATIFYVNLLTKFKYLDDICLKLEDLAISISCYEFAQTKHIESKPNDDWIIEILVDDLAKEQLIKNTISLLELEEEVELLASGCVPETNWLDEVAKNISKIKAGRFTIDGIVKHHPSKYHLTIKAARAFGSGEHETTKLCLLGISYLCNKSRFTHILDLGSGSGILAMAASKLSNAEIWATDIDDVAVKTCIENINSNKIQSKINCFVSNGYKSSKFRGKKFDLIIANILARPLVSMSQNTYQHLQKGGFAIFSGIIRSQERMIINAHKKFGMKLIKTFRLGHWSMLIMQR